MTDKEIGRAIELQVWPGDSAAWEPDILIRIGRAARTLLAARPEVTREAVDDFAKKQVRPFGDVDANWKAASEIAHRAISHFAPAREARQIDGMSVEECVELAKKIWLQHNGTITSTINKIGAAFHRLAQPVPVVDPDAEAKRLAWVQYTTAGGGHRVDADALWRGFDSAAKDSWRAVVAAAKEAWREDHG